MWTSSSSHHSGASAPRLLALAAACAGLLPGAAVAQQLPRQIPPLGTQVRVLLNDSTRAHGTLVTATPETISLRRLVGAGDPDILERTIPLDSIVTLWRRAGTRWALGALIGAPIAIAGLIVAAQHDTDSGAGGGCDLGCIGALGAAGAAGALLGGLVGHQIVRWEVVPAR